MDSGQITKRLRITREQLYRVELLGGVRPAITRRGKRQFRSYTEADLRKLEIIFAFVEDGYRYDAAVRKAEERLAQPELALAGKS